MITCKGQNCWAKLEWFICPKCSIGCGGLVRVFAGGNKDHIDPFCYALAFVVRERFSEIDSEGRLGLIEYVGVHPVMQKCQYKVLRQTMRNAGWGILSTRIKDGQSRTIEICKRKRKSNT